MTGGHVLCAIELLTLMVIIRLGAAVILTEFTATTLLEMWFSLLPKLLPLLLGRKFRLSFQATRATPQMSSCLIGPEAVRLLSTLPLFPLFNKQLSRVPPQPKATRCWWGRPESSLPMVPNANLLESLLFRSPLKL